MVEAVIFDLDGVLLETEEIWDDVRERLVVERGGHYDAAAQRAMMGMSSLEWSTYIHEELGVRDPPLSGLECHFAATVSSEEVARGKPAPDVYLEAARRLAVEPGRCAAVEDSHSGIRSAKAAGMRVIAIPNRTYPPDRAALAEADVVLRSIVDLEPAVVA